MAFSKEARRSKIKSRIKSAVSGDSAAPRLTVYRSNKQIYAQVIDDVRGVTLVSASSKEKEVADASKAKPKNEQAKLVGKAVAEKAKKAGIAAVRFDRNGYLYHGRVKSLAEGAREAGLNF